MDNNDSNIKSQQTGGLKLMTVFIAVLALHVVVIGGFTVYHLMSGGTDSDVVSTDKTKKDIKPADATATASTTTPDAAQPDKTTPGTTPSTDVATAPATPSVPDITGPNEIVPPTPGPAPLLKPTQATTPLATATTPLTLAPSDSLNNEKLTSLAPLTSDLAPSATPPSMITPSSAATPSPATTTTPAPAASAALAAGPVHMPPPAKAPSPTHVDGQTYTVKITDSYKKIAAVHHVTVAQLKEANHIKSDTLHAGQKLIIPSAKTLVAGAAAASSLDAKPATTTLAQSALVPVSKTTASGSHEHLYTIAKGDTLVKIAHKFKTTKSAIMAENNMTDATKLTIGKKLKIPSKEARSAGNTVPAAVPVAPQVQPQIQPAPQPQVEAKSTDTSAQLANFRGSTDF